MRNSSLASVGFHFGSYFGSAIQRRRVCGGNVTCFSAEVSRSSAVHRVRMSVLLLFLSLIIYIETKRSIRLNAF